LLLLKNSPLQRVSFNALHLKNRMDNAFNGIKSMSYTPQYNKESVFYFYLFGIHFWYSFKKKEGLMDICYSKFTGHLLCVSRSWKELKEYYPSFPRKTSFIAGRPFTQAHCQTRGLLGRLPLERHSDGMYPTASAWAYGQKRVSRAIDLHSDRAQEIVKDNTQKERIPKIWWPWFRYNAVKSACRCERSTKFLVFASRKL